MTDQPGFDPGDSAIGALPLALYETSSESSATSRSLPPMVGAMEVRLGTVCREAREQSGLRMIDIATAADVSEATISNFEAGKGWRRRTDEIVAAYERECQLPRGELWRRAAQA